MTETMAGMTAAESLLRFIDALCDERVHRPRPGTMAAQEAARWRAWRASSKPERSPSVEARYESGDGRG